MGKGGVFNNFVKATGETSQLQVVCLSFLFAHRIFRNTLKLSDFIYTVREFFFSFQETERQFVQYKHSIFKKFVSALGKCASICRFNAPTVTQSEPHMKQHLCIH